MQGRSALSSILVHLGIVEKLDVDITTEDGFIDWVVDLALALRIADQFEVDQAIEGLRSLVEQNWPGMTAAQVDKALGDIQKLVTQTRDTIIAAQEVMLGSIAQSAILNAKDATNARYAFQAFPIASFSIQDENAQKFLVNSTAAFMRARSGEIAEKVSAQARKIVANGLAEGVGRATIARDLQAALGSARDLAYYNLIAGAFLNQARSYGQLVTMGNAGIEKAEVLAVLDERTSIVCRFLDGKIVDVNGSLEQFKRLEALEDPLDVKTAKPWISHGKDDDGHFLFVNKADGTRETVARVVRSGVGAVDDRGEFAGGLSSERLGALGVGPPPYHGHCRSALIPVIV